MDAGGFFELGAAYVCVVVVVVVIVVVHGCLWSLESIVMNCL